MGLMGRQAGCADAGQKIPEHSGVSLLLSQSGDYSQQAPGLVGQGLCKGLGYTRPVAQDAVIFWKLHIKQDRCLMRCHFPVCAQHRAIHSLDQSSEPRQPLD